MTEHWQLAIFITGLVASWNMILLGVIRTFMSRNSETLEKRMAGLASIADRNQGIERQILELKAELPINYVRKEDFIRHEVVINTKLDRLRDLIEDIREKQNG